MDYSRLSIVKVPNPVLYQVAEPVVFVNDDVRALAARMIELMAAHRGVGLAANQVGIPLRLFVAHVPGVTKVPTVYINPTIIPGGAMGRAEEGCLSDPGARVFVRRPNRASINCLDEHGQNYQSRAFGLLARVWQHEIDHLNGINIRPRPVEVAA